MAKLHIYQKSRGGQWDTKAGDGDGNPTKAGIFDVTMTSVSIPIASGHTYQIRKGQSASGDLYDCRTGAQQRRDTAKFEKS